MSGSFEDYSNADLAALIEMYPLAWVVSRAGRFRATLLPILLECDENGAPISLLGHFARSNPQVETIVADPAALFLFIGAHGYISPSMAGRGNWGPTWNYAAARIEAEITLDPELNDAAVARLVYAMERGRSEPWTTGQLGERYGQLIRHVVAFQAKITRIDARFKLGQDESDADFANIVESLGESDLGGWMVRMNRQRDPGQ